MAEILIIDDDQMFCQTLSAMVKQVGHRATYALSLGRGMKRLLSGSFDLVFLDVRLPDGSGLDALPKMQEVSSSPQIIILTGYGNANGAELAISSGVWDYLQKPVTLETVTLHLSRALLYREEKHRKAQPLLRHERIIGKSPEIGKALDLAAQAAGSNANVLVTGETGTGKELFAWAIHENSARAYGNFVVLDCGALPKTLVEGILFGHEKGAFTGADRARDGVIRQADGGTLFLDEVAELPLSIQKAFLRVLQERKFRPLGSKKEIESDFRVVAATNQDLDSIVKSGRFRKDLFYRLGAFTIPLPPLRERKEDIRDLALHYLKELYERYGIKPKEVAEELLDALALYDWPGNVRDLVNVMETTLAAAREDSVLFPRHLPNHLRIQVARSSIGEAGSSGPSVQPMESAELSSHEILPFAEYRKDLLESGERGYLARLMSYAETIPEACRISGLSRSRIYDLLRKHGMLKKKFELLFHDLPVQNK